MIIRKIESQEIENRLAHFRVTAILGPRQSGKTTLAKTFLATDYFDLENPRDLARMQQPQTALENLRGLIVIDEIQRKPDLFPLLRYLVDTHPQQKYLILGSASRDLIRQSSESLAGRISFFTLHGFRQDDIDRELWPDLWFRGGLPPAFLAESDLISIQWRQDYISSFLERDIPNLGIQVPAATMRRFWQMQSHYHGTLINFSEIGRSFGMSDNTIRHYLEILQGTFMVRLLQPWHGNIGKRLIKRPKFYVRDSGLLHSLLAIENLNSLHSHPKLGSSWEGFALEAVTRSINKPDDHFYFWGTHSGAEVDLLWQHDARNYACEFKFADAPVMTRSMTSAVESLNLAKLWIVYPGDQNYQLADRIYVLPLRDVAPYWIY